MNGINGGEMPMPTQPYVAEMTAPVDVADQGMNSNFMYRARVAAGTVIVGGIVAVGAYFGVGGEAQEPVVPGDQTSETTGHVCNTIVKQCETTSVPGDPEPTDPIKVTTTESTVPSSTTTTEASTTTTTEASTTTTSEASTTTTTRPGSTTTTEGPHETVPGVETTNVPTSELVTG